jgi:hypothetical protein
MRKRLILLGLLALAPAFAPSAARALPVKQQPRSSAYIDPFTDEGWEPARTDMGVDWIPVRRLPVLAIGDAVILGSDGHSGWPGKHIIWYQLRDGSHAGDVIYVAEHLTQLLPTGSVVRAGQRIATALPGSPWTEWGWADEYGSPRAYPCYREGRQTNSGKEMARFMQSLGATVADPPGRGPDRPTGKLC